MYAVTPLKSPPKSVHIDDGAVLDFCAIIEETKADQWQKRTNALQQLVGGIPNEITSGADTYWYNSPKYIRHLALPLSELLKDPRSSVVKRTADSCTSLFGKCGADARYLLKDLMPTILAVHAQTVTVIRNAVLEMMMESLPMVPCKSVMPLLLEKLKSDKSRTVREACAVYLSLALESWTDEGYLTEDIWFQVGTSLVRALRDASPSVRSEAKKGVEQCRVSQPHVWHRLTHDPEGPAAVDPKLKRMLLRMSNDESVDSLSVASRGSYASSRSRQMFPPRHHQRPARPVPAAVVFQDSPQPQKKSGLGPPMRVTQSTYGSSSAESPRRRTNGKQQRSTPQRYKVGSPARRLPSPTAGVETNRERVDSDTLKSDLLGIKSDLSNLDIVTAGTGTTVDTAAEDESPRMVFEAEEGPFIASIQELKEKTTGRRSRRSSILQERFRLSSSNLASSSNLLDESADSNKNGEANVVVAMPPEHMKIAQQLLEAHRSHVDKIMETLRMEMDALKEFEMLVIDESRPTRPTEDEVLDYFESVGLCLDQRTSSGRDLQREMDRISKEAL
jgi:hypothetical protein